MSEPITSDQIEQARTLIKASANVMALTGAGLSTDSGIPDFRGPRGVWTLDPDAEKLSNIHCYLKDESIRAKAWRGRLESPVWSAQPSDGHRALAKLEASGKLKALITQNIDGLHQLAGNNPARVIEMHGTIWEVMCLNCTYRAPMTKVLTRLRAGEVDPDCPVCGGILKSATVSFGQPLMREDMERAEQACRECNLLLAIGSSLSVYPVAGLLPLAREYGAKIIIVNAVATSMDSLAHMVFLGRISNVLPRLFS